MTAVDRSVIRRQIDDLKSTRNAAAAAYQEGYAAQSTKMFLAAKG